MSHGEIADAAHIAVVSGICWAVLCRARHMTHRTLLAVRMQHGLLNAAAVLSLIVPADWRAPAIASGVLPFLLLSSYRWRDGAPDGTINRVAPSSDERACPKGTET